MKQTLKFAVLAAALGLSMSANAARVVQVSTVVDARSAGSNVSVVSPNAIPVPPRGPVRPPVRSPSRR